MRTLRLYTVIILALVGLALGLLGASPHAVQMVLSVFLGGFSLGIALSQIVTKETA